MRRESDNGRSALQPGTGLHAPHVAFDGGQMTSDAGILLLAAIEQRLGIAERLADCIEDPRAPERVRHGLAEMIRYRALLIAAGAIPTATTAMQ